MPIRSCASGLLLCLQLQLVTGQVVTVTVSVQHTFGSLYLLLSELTFMPPDDFRIRSNNPSKIFTEYDTVISHSGVVNDDGSTMLLLQDRIVSLQGLNSELM